MEDFISCTLPGIGREKTTQLDQKLTELGVFSLEDLKYVEEKDVESILQPIQVKKFLDHCKNFKFIPTASPQKNYTSSYFPENLLNSSKEVREVILQVSADNSISLNHSAFPSPANQDWANDFAIPFESFPKEIKEACEKGERPSKMSVNEMVRTVITRICNIDPTPGRKNLRIIAAKIIHKFPGIFEDCFDGKIIGDGLTTLMKKLENCLDNRKRMRSSIEDCFHDVQKKRKTTRESYGCVQWQPMDLPLSETKEEMLKYKQFLLEEFVKNTNRNDTIVSECMKKTYPLQRFFINNVQSSISAVKENWPFLLEKEYLFSHSTILLGKDILQLFLAEIPKRGKKIYDFMKSKTKLPNVVKCLNDIEKAKKINQNLTPEYYGSLPLLMAYFKEEESLLFKEKLGPDDIKNDSLLTPYLVTFGSDLYAAKEYALVIDGQITTYLCDFITALAALFVSYYVFNIQYNADTALTMEFIQRCIADINPKRGTKANKKEKGNKHYTITRNVLNLAHEINDFDRIFKV